MRALRFLTLMLTALTMSMAFCHLLAMPAKLAYQGPVWLLLQQTLYGNFRVLGLFLELGAVACVLLLTLRVRRSRPALGWTVFASVCLLGAQAAWWTGVVPANAQIAQFTAHTLPADWTLLRLQWEYMHAVRAVLQVAALGALLLSVLAETPRRL
jgi:Domain of unknown function (DUF1772)